MVQVLALEKKSWNYNRTTYLGVILIIYILLYYAGRNIAVIEIRLFHLHNVDRVQVYLSILVLHM